MTCSDWESSSLTQEQLDYAAYDAYLSVVIGERLEQIKIYA